MKIEPTTLSQEELIYLLWQNKTQSIPSLGTDPMEHLDSSNQTLALAIAERALLARGFLVTEGEAKGMPIEQIQSLLSHLAQATELISTKQRESDASWDTAHYYLGEEKVLLHQPQTDGIHHFEWLKDLPPTVKNRLSATEKPMHRLLDMPPSGLLAAVEKAGRSLEECTRYLLTLNANKDAATTFANVLINWGLHISVVRINLVTGTFREVNFYEYGGQTWAIVPADDQPGIERLLIGKI